MIISLPTLPSWLAGKNDDTQAFDVGLLWLFLTLLAFGLVLVASASMPVALNLTDDAFYFAKRHGVYLVMCLVLMGIAASQPMAFWQRSSGWLLLMAVLLLVAVLVVGNKVNGATRWIGVGPINIQPAELAKLSFFIFLSGFLVRKRDEVQQRIRGFFKPMLVMGLIAFLLLCQPDMGSTVVIAVGAMGMLFIAGAKLYQFIILLGVLGGAGALLIAGESYRMRRITGFMDPWADPFGSGYQLTQSLMAFGRGGWTGQGLGNSIQKLQYLPEAHTDFVAAVLAEELGFIGVVLLLLIIGTLVMKAFFIGRRALLAGQDFAGYLAMAIAIWFSFQTVVNVGAASGLLPTKGLTFPLISYGGSSMLIVSVAIGILLRIDYEYRLAPKVQEDADE